MSNGVSTRPEFSDAGLSDQQKKVAQSSFEAVIDPYRRGFESRLEKLTENLASRGIANDGLAGLEGKNYERLLENESLVEGDIAKSVASDIGRSALDQAFQANENAIARNFQKEQQQAGFDFASSESDLERQSREAIEQNRLETTSNENSLDRLLQTELQKSGQEFTASERQAIQDFDAREREFAQQFSQEERQAVQEYETARQQAGFDQQISLLDKQVATARQDQLLQLALNGNVSGEEVDKLLQDVYGNGIIFSNEDELRLQRAAKNSGLSVEEYSKIRSALGSEQALTILKDPSQFIVDPEREREFQLQLSREANEANVQAAKYQSQGGKVLCTELFHQGKLPLNIYVADSRQGYKTHPTIKAGYHLWAKPLVKLMQRSKCVTTILSPFIKSWAYHMAYREDVIKTPNLFGAILEAVGIPLCYFIGLFSLSIKRERSSFHAITK